jgi:hypothetical protein
VFATLLAPPRPEDVERRRSARRRRVAVVLLAFLAGGAAIGDRMTGGRLRPAWAFRPAPAAAARSAQRPPTPPSTDSAGAPAPGAPGADRRPEELAELAAMARQNLVVYGDTLAAALDSFNQALGDSGGRGKRKEACARMRAAYMSAQRSSVAISVAVEMMGESLDAPSRRRIDEDSERVRAMPIRMGAACRG